MKVNFAIIGTQKGGTSALSYFVKQHPQIAFHDKKECHFFDNDNYFNNDYVDYSIYHQHWNHILLNPLKLSECKVYGEVTPLYMYWNKCMERIKQYNPEMKLICILRNPIDRAYSHWNINVHQNREFVSFSKALHLQKIRILTSKNGDRAYSYINRGFYSQQIKRMMNLFPRKQMLFIKNEDLKHNHQETLNSVFNFIEVDPFVIKWEIVHAYPYQLPMSESEREFLKETFAREIIDLENLLGWDLSEWKK